MANGHTKDLEKILWDPSHFIPLVGYGEFIRNVERYQHTAMPIERLAKLDRASKFMLRYHFISTSIVGSGLAVGAYTLIKNIF